MAKNKGKDVKKHHYKMGLALTENRKKEILNEAFTRRVGYPINWDNPQTMNEKIMWLKLNYQNPLITTCSDKFAVKDYVSEIVGEKYVVPTIASWSRVEDIDFDALPEKFVLKVNWSSGYNIIVKDKSKLDIEATKEKLRNWIRPDRNSYYQYFNWGYKHMKPVIYAEQYIEQIEGQVYDYKLYYSNGKFIYMFIATDRHGDNTLTYTFFDENLQHIPCEYGHKSNANPLPRMPKQLDKMMEIAEKLAKPFPYVRVDFYEIGDEIFLGEMTFYSGGGLLPFDPPEWDRKLGEKIQLPERTIIDREDKGMTLKKAYHLIRWPMMNAFESMKKSLKKFGKKIVHKQRKKGKKYLVILGLRLPYETHEEETKTEIKRYINILGLEFCYKKKDLPEKSENSNVEYEYVPNTTLMAFRMEDKITPQIQRIHCEQKAYKQLGYFPNLKYPQTLNEKIIWLALNYKNPEIAVATDKGTAKDWVASRIGAQHTVPLIGVYDDVNDIDFASLPNKFVAKLNDGWGADKVMIIRNKDTLNIDRTKAILSSWMYPWNNYYYQNMCITDEKMKNATIIIEEYLDAGNNTEPEDYKFYCCNGEPKFALVVAGRGSGSQTRSFVDMDWNVLPVARKGKKISYNVEKPESLDEMMDLARKLSKGFPFVRVDFYEVDGKVYVGEMTFTPGMFLKFSSRDWDKKLGDYLDLSYMVTALNEGDEK